MVDTYYSVFNVKPDIICGYNYFLGISQVCPRMIFFFECAERVRKDYHPNTTQEIMVFFFFFYVARMRPSSFIVIQGAPRERIQGEPAYIPLNVLLLFIQFVLKVIIYLCNMRLTFKCHNFQWFWVDLWRWNELISSQNQTFHKNNIL